MSVGIAAASIFFLVLAPASFASQDKCAVFEADALSAIQGTFKSAGGIASPLPCPPEAECMDPWADQNPTDLSQLFDSIGTLSAFETGQPGRTRGMLGDWSSAGGGSMSVGGYHEALAYGTFTSGGQERTFWAERSNLDLGRRKLTESFIDFDSTALDTATMQLATPDNEAFSFSLDGATWALKPVSKDCDTSWP